LLLVGGGCVLISTAFDPHPTVKRVGANQPVDPRGARNATDFTAHNSPSLVRDPSNQRRLALAGRVDAPRYSCTLHVSENSGESWRTVPIPAPRGEEPKCFAPDVAYGADGTLYLSFVTLKGRGNVPNAVWISRLEDGRTPSEPRKALGPLAFQVRLTADREEPGRLFLTWLDASGVGLFKFSSPGNSIMAARSDDGGRTWGRGGRVSDPRRQRVVAPQPAAGPDGELYLLYLDLKEDRLDYEGLHRGSGGPPYGGRWELVLARSEDGGSTWSESVVEDRLVPAERFIAFIPPFPTLAIDPDGRLYAAFDALSGGDRDVLLWTLAPSVEDWEGPHRVNDTLERDETSQYLPKLATAPDGRLDILYYDRRVDPERDILTEASLQSSFDHGKTFGRRVRLSDRSFDSRVGLGSERDLADLGSRLGLLSNDARALAVWTDTRAGTPASGKQDLSTAAVAVYGNGTRLSDAVRGALRFGGIGLALVGVALLAPLAAPPALRLVRRGFRSRRRDSSA